MGPLTYLTGPRLETPGVIKSIIVWKKKKKKAELDKEKKDSAKCCLS